VPIASVRSKRLRDTTISIVQDCRPSVCVAPADAAQAVDNDISRLMSGIATLELNDWQDLVIEATKDDVRPFRHCGTALIQYTSGSTSAPKGVVVSQENVLSNLTMQRDALRNQPGVVYVGWAPFYHDMGLIGNILEPLYMGGHSVLMSPTSFARDPTVWMRAISLYRAEVSGGPNYAYDLCLKASAKIKAYNPDLSSWRVAFNSGEPVQAATVNKFSECFGPLGLRPEAMYPCYGMAEATLMISGRDPGNRTVIATADKQGLGEGRFLAPKLSGPVAELVGCGQALSHESILIVDPLTCRVCPNGNVGEIWVSGPNIPDRYWKNERASRETFHAKVSGDDLGQRYLRTGDLGLFNRGDLFIVGRLKDVIIIRGQNFYPQDIEWLTERSVVGTRAGANAAFSVSEPAVSDRLVVVQEVERSVRKSMSTRQATADLRRAIYEEYGLTLFDLVLIEPGTIPKTSSGKIRRGATRQRYLSNQLDRISPELDAHYAANSAM
jgi:acyl-CoA synthetase (AMP-forming)/AMP-acid ligase II